MKKNYPRLCLFGLATTIGLAGRADPPSTSNFYAGSGSVLYVGASGQLYVAGDAMLDAGSSTTGTGTLTTTGSLSVNTAVSMGGTLNISSASARSITGSGSLSVASLATNAGGLTLGIPVTVTSGTTLGGVLTTTATNLLTYANGATVGTVSDANHVNGPVCYKGTGSFTYPVGSAGHYRSVSVNLATNGSGMTATYTQGNPVTAFGNGTFNGGMSDVNRAEYWDLSPVSTATGTVTLGWNTASVPIGTITSIAPFTVAHLTGGAWQNEGGAGAGTGTIVAGTVSSTSTISTWSPFALGSTASNILPVTFLGIGATLQADGSRAVDWQVAQEVDVKNYTVQRSTDGGSFADLGNVAAANSSAAHGYGYTDATAAPAAALYYRVRENGADGAALYSGVAVVRARPGTGLSVTPNPVGGQMALAFGTGMAGSYRIALINAQGQTVYQNSLQVTANQSVTLPRPAGALPGLYLLRAARADGTVFSQELLFK